MKRFDKLTEIEQGALMVAFYKGKVIQCQMSEFDWAECPSPAWVPEAKYRVKPELEFLTCWVAQVGEDGSKAYSQDKMIMTTGATQVKMVDVAALKLAYDALSRCVELIKMREVDCTKKSETVLKRLEVLL